MKNLRLIPAINPEQNTIKAAFAFDWELIALVKSQKGARWSQILQSWYFSKPYGNKYNLRCAYTLVGSHLMETLRRKSTVQKNKVVILKRQEPLT